MTMLTPALVLEALGILGVVIYMVSYVFLNAGYITGHGYHYTLMNMAAAICVLASLSQSFNLALGDDPDLLDRHQPFWPREAPSRAPRPIASCRVREPSGIAYSKKLTCRELRGGDHY